MTLAAAWRFDLHLHSDRSDGRHPLPEVLARCARGGLDAIALTDHDFATTLPVGPIEIDGRTLHIIGGAEVSGLHEGQELHLLVYFPGEIPEGFRAFCVEQVKLRAQRYTAAVENLGLPGLPEADAAAWSGERSLTRMHLARALVAAGHARDVREAFARHVSHGRGTVPNIEIPYVECIRIARSFGGVTSWAHPPVPLVERFGPTFAAAGLHALEGLRPGVSGHDRRVLRKFARRHGMFLTGGSDWHGWGEPDPGLFAVPRLELTDFLAALAA